MSQKSNQASLLPGQEQELVRFLRNELDIVETMLALIGQSETTQHRLQACETARRGLQIIGEFSPRLKDHALRQRIQALARHYTRLLEARSSEQSRQ